MKFEDVVEALKNGNTIKNNDKLYSLENGKLIERVKDKILVRYIAIDLMDEDWEIFLENEDWEILSRKISLSELLTKILLYTSSIKCEITYNRSCSSFLVTLSTDNSNSTYILDFDGYSVPISGGYNCATHTYFKTYVLDVQIDEEKTTD